MLHDEFKAPADCGSTLFYSLFSHTKKKATVPANRGLWGVWK